MLALLRPVTVYLMCAIVGTTALAAAQAEAEPPRVCGKRTELVARLTERFGETRRSVGYQRGRGIVEVFASDRTGSWTILITTPRGQSCLVAAGEAFEAIARAPDGPAI